ncbi:IPT/TIG domain-containing protein [Streptomyces sp. NPDC007861]|uniref:IPT/TIG domain-containing protein n=1 Tax=Streptomyces sp. NPDC007861 TaxID=3154893 RepID=UPI003403AE18
MPIDPDQGSTGGGTAVTVTGTNLGGATAVLFGYKQATITGNSATSVSVVSPSGAGVVETTVITPGGKSGAVPFHYTPPPVVVAVSPASGPVAGGSTITITGRNLGTAETVDFGGTAATPVVVDDSSLTVLTPAAAAGTVSLVVTTRGGIADASFSFVDPPTATGFAPLTGLPAGGTVVSITGGNLSTTTGVTFDDLPATFAVLSDTQVVALAPAHGPGTAAIEVTTTGGSDTAPGLFLYAL